MRSKYLDSQGYFTAAAIPSKTVCAAVADPDGARIALLSYGEFQDYPAAGIPPILTHRGKESWAINILNANPETLGLAWLLLEEAHAQPLATIIDQQEAGNAQRKQGDDKMPVIQYSPSTGAALETGYYRAKITEILEETGQFGPQFRFQWVIIDSDGEETSDEIRSWTSQKWHEKAKLFALAKATLRSKCPIPPAPIDTDLLLNKKADIEIVPYKRADGSDGTKIGAFYPFGSMTKEEPDEDAGTPFAKERTPLAKLVNEVARIAERD